MPLFEYQLAWEGDWLKRFDDAVLSRNKSRIRAFLSREHCALYLYSYDCC